MYLCRKWEIQASEVYGGTTVESDRNIEFPLDFLSNYGASST